MEVSKKRYVIQDSGQVTLPVDFRRKYDLKTGDEITFEETAAGLLISTKELALKRILDEIGQELRKNDVSLEELIESGRDIRGELLREKYGIDPQDD